MACGEGAVHATRILVASILAIFLFFGALESGLSSPDVSVNVIVPEPAYALGSRVEVYVRATLDGAPYSGAVILWELKDPSGVRKDFGQVGTNATGYATIAFQSSEDWPPGSYTILAAVSGTEARTTGVVYLKRLVAKLVIAVSPSATWRGDNVTVSGYVVMNPPPTTYLGIPVKIYIDGQLRWTLSLRADGTFSSPPFNTSVLLSGTRRVEAVIEETPEYFRGQNSTSFRIDRVLVVNYKVPEPSRVNANSTQRICFELRYESDYSIFSDAYGNRVWINGTLASYSSAEGCWFINYTANLGRYVFMVSRILDNQVTKSEKFYWMVTPPSIIWDAIVLANWTLADVDARVDVNSTQSIYFFAYYWYDLQPLRGEVTLNGTFTGGKWVSGKGIEVNVTHPTVAKVVYTPTRVSDSLYGLSAFILGYTEAPSLIWDMVLVDASAVSKSRADVGSRQWVRYRLIHAFDGEPVTGGSVILGGTPAVYRVDGWWEVEVTSSLVQRVVVPVTSVLSQHGITVYRYTIPAASVIFDQVVFEVSAPLRVNVGTAVGDKLKVTAYYAYDREPFEGTYLISPSPQAVVSEVSAVSYSVTQMNEVKYGLSKFVSTVATVRYDRLIITSYKVDNNLRILEFAAAYESDKAPAAAEVRIVAAGEVLATLTTTLGGAAKLNMTPILGKLYRVDRVLIEPVRSTEYEVTVGVGVEVPVKLLQRVISVDPKCQNNFIVRAEPLFGDGRIAKAAVRLGVEALETKIVELKSGEELRLILKPGTNTLTVLGLFVEETGIIVPNVEAFTGFKQAYSVALDIDLLLPTFQFTGYPGARLGGVIGLRNTGNVSLCDVRVVISVEGEGFTLGTYQEVVRTLPLGGREELAIPAFRIVVAYLVGNFSVSVTAYYDPDLRLASRAANVVFVRELPPDLQTLTMKREELLSKMPEWDRAYFIGRVDEQVSTFYATGNYSRTAVDELIKRLYIVEELIKSYDEATSRLDKLEERYREFAECLSIPLVRDELNKAVETWKQLRHAEALAQLSLVNSAVSLVDEFAFDLARVCTRVAALPAAQKEYFRQLVAGAVRLALQNRTQQARAALIEAGQVGSLMSDAWDVLRRAEEAVARAEQEGRTWGLERARSLLDEARSLFEQGKFKDAQSRALEAIEAANSAVSPLAIFAPTAIAIVVVIVVGYLAYRAIKIRRALKI
ncbi:MAG: DUF4398 domain-containing protein [Ignisphaera sp.]